MLRLCSVAIVLAAQVSYARAGNFTHESNVKIDVKLTDRSRAIEKHDTAATPIPPDGLLAVELLLDGIHVEQEALLKDLIKQTPDSAVDEKAEYYFRLGEIYAKQNRAHRLKGIELEIAAGKKHDAALAQQSVKHKDDAKQALLSAIDTYTKLITTPAFANYPKMDMALFVYSYTLQAGGYPKEARSGYDKLLKNYPHSKYVADAHFAFGEYFFEVGQLADAEARYKEVLHFPQSSVYWYAQYKLGWVLLNQKKHQEALEVFYQVAQGTVKDANRVVLHRAAKHDFVRAYAEIGRADKALPAFQRVDAADGYGMLATLADLYGEQGKSDKAIFVYRQLIKEQPKNAQVCAWEHSVAQAMLTVGTMTDRVHEIEQLVKLYAALRDHKAIPPAELGDCRDNAAEMSGQLARAYHQEAVKTQNVELVGYSDRLYRAYLGAFRDAADFGDTQYFHAELNWVGAEMEKVGRLATDKWQAAAQSFTDVVTDHKVSPKLIQVSADAAMLAWLKALAIDPRNYGTPPEDSSYATVPAEKAIPDREQKLLAAFDLYLTNVKDPGDDERIQVQFAKARLLRKFDHHKDAIAILVQIIKQHPEHEAAEYAAQLVFDSYNLLHQYDEMLAFGNGLSQKFLAAHPHVDDTRKKLVRQSVRKQAEEAEARGKKTGDLAAYVECGEKYLEALNLAPEATDADVVLYNAGVCFEQGRSLSASIEVYEQLEKLYPKSTHAAHAVARLGGVYATTAQYREASERFEEYASKYAGQKDALDLFSDAVQFRKGMGDDKQAIADTDKFITLYGNKKPTDAANAFFSMITIYEKQGDLDKLAHHLRAYIDKYGKIGGAEKLVTAWSKLGETLWTQACSVATVDGACAKVVRSAALAKKLTLKPKADSRKHCSDKTQLTVVPRDEKRSRDAMAAFGSAIAAFEQNKGKLEGNAGARYYYALARFTKVEHDYEHYLGLPIPASLDFDPRKPAVAKKSLERFDTWFKAKQTQAVALRKAYDPITRLGDAAITISAAARIAATLQGFSDQLYTAEIPANLRTGEFAEDTSSAYCEKLEEYGTPLEKEALDYYQGCLVTSTKLGWFSDWSKICERELGELRPDEWPTATEVHHEATSVATITAVVDHP